MATPQAGGDAGNLARCWPTAGVRPLGKRFFNRARGGRSFLDRCRGHGSFRARGASMRVARRRIHVSDGVIAPTFSAISATCVPGRDGVLGGRASAARSCRRPAEILLAGPQPVQQHRELAGDRDPRLLDADPLGERPAPAAQRASALQPRQQHGRRLVQIAAQQRVALTWRSAPSDRPRPTDGAWAPARHRRRPRGPAETGSASRSCSGRRAR